MKSREGTGEASEVVWRAQHSQRMPSHRVEGMLQCEAESGRRHGQRQDPGGFISHARESGLPPEAEVSLQRHFKQGGGTDLD